MVTHSNRFPSSFPGNDFYHEFIYILSIHILMYLLHICISREIKDLSILYIFFLEYIFVTHCLRLCQVDIYKYRPNSLILIAIITEVGKLWLRAYPACEQIWLRMVLHF